MSVRDELAEMFIAHGLMRRSTAYSLLEAPVSEFNKTLDELWKEAGEKPFQATNACAPGVVFLVHSKSQDGVAFVVESKTELRYNQPYNAAWRLHVEAPKPVPHWPAVCHINGTFKVLDSLFPSAARGHEVFKADFIRLATEYPPIMLVPEAKK